MHPVYAGTASDTELKWPESHAYSLGQLLRKAKPSKDLGLRIQPPRRPQQEATAAENSNKTSTRQPVRPAVSTEMPGPMVELKETFFT